MSIIGEPRAASVPARPTGRRHFGTAVANLPTLDVAMLGADPETTDRALVASLPRSISSVLREVRTTKIDPTYGFDDAFESFTLACRPGDQDLEVALALVDRAMSSAPSQVLRRELVRLRLSTKSRAEDATEMAMMISIYEEEMSGFPADVAIEATRYLGRTETFWPSLSALRERMQYTAHKRNALRRVITSELDELDK